MRLRSQNHHLIEKAVDDRPERCNPHQSIWIFLLCAKSLHLRRDSRYLSVQMLFPRLDKSFGLEGLTFLLLLSLAKDVLDPLEWRRDRRQLFRPADIGESLCACDRVGYRSEPRGKHSIDH